MKFLSVLSRTRKSVLLILPLLLLGSYAIHEAVGRSGGVIGLSKIGCGTVYNGCHGTQSSATVISISTTSAQIVAGQTYIFRIAVANPNEAAAGCDISADKGTLLVSSYGSGLQAASGELTQNQRLYFTGDSAVWTFKYKAPTTTGKVHIYAAGNAVNADFAADAGDHWNLAVDTLTIVSSGVAPKAIPTADIQIFPNPSTTGRLTLASLGINGSARIAVSDPAGKVVMHGSLMLGSESPLDLSTLPNGTYFLSIQARDGQSFVKRIVLQR